VVITPALLAGPGPAVVAALSAVTPVIVLAGLHGDPEDAAVAARRLFDYGASWVTVQAVDGIAVMRAVADAVGGGLTMAVTLRPGLDDAAVAASRLGESRGRVVSRLAAAAGAAGVGAVICTVADLGVVHQVAPGMERVAWGAGTPAEAAQATTRGASGVILDAAVLAGRDPAEALAAFESLRGRGIE
jgi:orotidine-5'-phosphate decarboxylase